MKRYSLVFAFLFVIISNVSWAGVEGRVKCGETTTIYTNTVALGTVITILATDKCPGLDSKIHRCYKDPTTQEETCSTWAVPDGQSTSISVGVSEERYKGVLKLECNGTNSKGFCTFVIVDVK